MSFITAAVTIYCIYAYAHLSKNVGFVELAKVEIVSPEFELWRRRREVREHYSCVFVIASGGAVCCAVWYRTKKLFDCHCLVRSER